MSFIRLSRFFLPISVLLVLTSIVLFIVPGPRVGIEFTGGTLMELSIPQGKTADDLEKAMRSFTALPLSDLTITQTRTGTFFVRSTLLTNEEHTALMEHVKTSLGAVTELQYTTIGPTVGNTLKQRAFWALLAASVAIVVYLAIAFHKVPRELSPWTFGSCAVAALIHDIIITVGIFTVLGYFTTFQIDTLFVTALLSIMGYSVSDTIVIFDRIRDTIFEEGRKSDFAEVANRGLKQSMSRTLNTSLGALIMLFALFLFGSESIRWFMLALIIGTIVGTYSSFFIATPLLVLWQKYRSK